jgi:hypothetical protein
MIRVATIVSFVVGASFFWRCVTLADLSSILQPLIVAISIMAAALLVRLNRGMPTLDWKSLDVSDRKTLTGKIVRLSREYMVVLSIQALTLLLLLIVQLENAGLQSALVGDGDMQSPLVQRVILALTGGFLALSIFRMAYIVWRDYDIVRLQKKLIDDSADKEAVDKASAEALSKVAAIREAGVRGGPKPEVSGWSE